MDVSHIIDPLNDAQREAVTSSARQNLVLAGAGSGKTRVLVHRIAWLACAEGIPPFSQLAVTFTNKAASEMRSRTESLLGIPLAPMWIGTFHGLAHRLLRSHCERAGLPGTFQILDSDDQYRTIRRIIRAEGLDEERWKPRQIQGYINASKDKGLRPQHIDHAGDLWQERALSLYQQYEEHCQRAAVVDFAELLLRCHELLRDNDDLLAHYRARFRQILVDEFQDTNTIQYAWLRLLAGDDGCLFLVGDDDQSIYGWRGARIENLQRFNLDYPDTCILRLEQNYRSTSTILDAANSLIANNRNRMGKSLWTEGARGDPIRLYRAFNDRDESAYVIERIRHWFEQGGRYQECAILYRSNAQSRLFEEELVRSAIPYHIHGGLRFFERAEIKDALAYLRLVAQHDDDTSFERIVNNPPRSIGERTMEGIRDRARGTGMSLWRSASTLLEDRAFPARTANAVAGFIDKIDGLLNQIAGLPLWEQIDLIINQSGLVEHYGKERGERGQARIENLQELVNAARQFIDAGENRGIEHLVEFLAHAALEGGEHRTNDGDAVQLMTLHAAKGLEFPLVFLCGMEEGLFPHKLSSESERGLEEERRLCYVGITRARQQLYLTHAEYRRIHGREGNPHASRFVAELPEQLLDPVRPLPASPGRFNPSGLYPPLSNGTSSGFSLGQRVSHPMFGIGVVLQAEGDGSHARIQVNFEESDSKWLLLSYANLTPLP